MLSQSQIAAYHHDGFSFPHAALSLAELEECRAGLARYEAWLGQPVNHMPERWRSGTYCFLPWVDKLIRHPRILDVIEDIMGPDIFAFTTTFFIKDADSPTFALWHQDSPYFGLRPHEHVTCWVALTDATAEAGCMEVVPERGAARQLHHEASGLKNNINAIGQQITDAFDQSGTVMMEVPAAFHCITRCACTARGQTGPTTAASASARATSRRIAAPSARFGCACRWPAAATPGEISTSCRHPRASFIPMRSNGTRRFSRSTAPISTKTAPITNAPQRNSDTLQGLAGAEGFEPPSPEAESAVRVVTRSWAPTPRLMQPVQIEARGAGGLRLARAGFVPIL
jgi:hypothetical protein